jgi:hypothetical protein
MLAHRIPVMAAMGRVGAAATAGVSGVAAAFAWDRSASGLMRSFSGSLWWSSLDVRQYVSSQFRIRRSGVLQRRRHMRWRRHSR